MSRSVDNRVVEMEFDNSKFEKNVSQSLSTLDKLKAALSFKHVDDDFSNVENATDKLGKSFSALEAIAVGALMNIGSKVADWAEKTIRELSGVENVIRGFQKFGDITKSSATLAAQGFENSEIESQLKRLNWFTDETSYNLTDMVDNISKFTATGQGLTESADAMQGIALWAALSGQNAGTASRAMYQLSQAMGSGYMRLEDWKSIQNANMDTDEFRQHVLDAAVALGTLKKNADGTYQSLIEGLKKEGSEAFSKSQFTKNLTSGMWFTKDVMMTVYKDYAKGADKIYEYIQSHAGATVDDAIKALGDSLDEFGKKAFLAGQEARTWEDALESVKDALSTKWMGIFQSIFGNFEEATKFFTDLSVAFYDTFVEPMSRYAAAFERWDEEGGAKLLRGKIVEGLYAINDLVGKVRESFDDFFYWDRLDSTTQRAIETAAKLKADAAEIRASLAESGEVDESRLAEAKRMERQWKEIVDKYHLDAEDFDADNAKENFLIGQRTERLKKFSDGFANLIDKLKEVSEDTQGFQRILKGVFAIADMIGQAVSGLWDALAPFREDLWSIFKKGLEILADIGDWFVDLSNKLRTNDTLKKFFTTLLAPLVNLKNFVVDFYNTLIPKLKERFAGLSDVTEGVSKSFGNIKKVLKDLFDKVTDWWSKLFGNLDPEKTVENLFKAIDAVKKAFYDLTGIEPGTLGEKIQNGLNGIQKSLEKFRDEAPEKINDALKKIKGYFKTAFDWIKDHWEGIAKTIKTVWGGVWAFISGIWEGIKGLFQKDSEDGSSSMQGVIDTFKNLGVVIGNLVKIIGNALKPLSDGLKNTLENMSLEGAGDFLKGGGLAAIGVAILKFSKNLRESNILKGLNEILGAIGDVLNSFAHVLDAKALKEAAVAVAILVGALFFLISMPTDQLASAVTVLSIMIAVLTKAMKNLSGITSSMSLSKSGFSRNKNSAGMMFVEMAAGLLIIAFAMKAIAKIPTQDLYTALVVITIIVAVMVAAIKAMTKLYANKGDTNTVYNKKSGNKFNNNSIIKMGGPAATLLAFALIIGVVALTLKSVTKLIRDDVASFVASFVFIALAIAGIAYLTKQMSKVKPIDGSISKTILSFAALIFVVAESIKILSGIDPGMLAISTLVIALIMLIMKGIIDATKGRTFKNFDGFAKALKSFALVIAMMAVIIWALSDISPEKLLAATGVIAGISLIFAGMVALSTWKKFKPANFKKMTVCLLLLSAGIAIMAAVAYGLAQLSNEKFAKGLVGLAAIALIISGLSYVASKTGNGIEKVGKAFLYIAGGAGLLAIGLLAVSKALEILSGDTIDVKKAFDKISKIMDEFLDNLPEWLAKVSVAIVGFIPKLIGDVIVELVKLADELITKFKEEDTITKLVNGFIDVACMVIDAVSAKMGKIVESTGNLVLSILTSLGNWLTNNREAIKNALTSFIKGIKDVIEELFDGLGKSIFETITGEGEDAWDTWKGGALAKILGWVGMLALGMIALMGPVSLKVLGIITLITTAIDEIKTLLDLVGELAAAYAAEEAAKEYYESLEEGGKREARLHDYFYRQWLADHPNKSKDGRGSAARMAEAEEYAKQAAEEAFAKGWDYKGNTLLTSFEARQEFARMQKMYPNMTDKDISNYIKNVPSGTVASQYDAWQKSNTTNNTSNTTYNYTQNITSPEPVKPIDTYRYAKLGFLDALAQEQS